MWIDIFQVVVSEPLVYLLEQFSGGLQINTGGTDVHMPHISGKGG
jgi:hypothetical protein